jgi:ABC-type iron transport system FetAB permease component
MDRISWKERVIGCIIAILVLISANFILDFIFKETDIWMAFLGN